MDTKHLYSSGWRDHKKTPQIHSLWRRLFRKKSLIAFSLGFTLIGIFLIFFGVPWISEQMSQARGSLSKMENQAGSLPGREVEKAVPIDPESLNLDLANLSEAYPLSWNRLWIQGFRTILLIYFKIRRTYRPLWW